MTLDEQAHLIAELRSILMRAVEFVDATNVTSATVDRVDAWWRDAGELIVRTGGYGLPKKGIADMYRVDL